MHRNTTLIRLTQKNRSEAHFEHALVYKMSEAIITVQNTARELVESRIGELELRKNLAGQYNHDDIVTLQKGMENILGSQWNNLTLQKGVNILSSKANPVLMKRKETDVINMDSVLD